MYFAFTFDVTVELLFITSIQFCLFSCKLYFFFLLFLLNAYFISDFCKLLAALMVLSELINIINWELYSVKKFWNHCNFYVSSTIPTA